MPPARRGPPRAQPRPRRLAHDARWLAALLIAVWLVELANTLLDHRLDRFGIYPRELFGLRGILLAPFLHGGVGHAFLNTLPLLVLGGLVVLGGERAFLERSIAIVLLCGAGVWLFGRSSYHIGASGLVAGYFGYLVGRGVFARGWRAAGIAFVTLVLYGGLLWSVLPTAGAISWESHLAGLLAGLLVARAWAPAR